MREKTEIQSFESKLFSVAKTEILVKWDSKEDILFDKVMLEISSTAMSHSIFSFATFVVNKKPIRHIFETRLE